MLGAKEKNGFAQVDGLDEGHIVGLKKNFWDMAHNPQKVSVPLVSEGQVHEEMTIPGAPRSPKQKYRRVRK